MGDLRGNGRFCQLDCKEVAGEVVATGILGMPPSKVLVSIFYPALRNLDFFQDLLQVWLP